jgi:hypothetical protein
MTGFVYAIGDGEGRVKIGWSADPLRRLVKLRSDCPGEVKLLGVIEATKAQEAEAHELLAPWRVSGEWFRCEGPVAAFVGMLALPKPKPIDVDPNPHPLKYFLADREMSQAEFAKRIGSTQASVSRYVAGARMPRREHLARIRKATGGTVTADDFLSHDAPPQQMRRSS